MSWLRVTTAWRLVLKGSSIRKGKSCCIFCCCFFFLQWAYAISVLHFSMAWTPLCTHFRRPNNSEDMSSIWPSLGSKDRSPVKGLFPALNTVFLDGRRGRVGGERRQGVWRAPVWQEEGINGPMCSMFDTCIRTACRAGHFPPRQWPWLPVKALNFITGCIRADTYNG